MSADEENTDLQSDAPFLLNYPNLQNPTGRVVLSNEHVVVQRLLVGPGEWEGVHSHPGNQIYIHIHGGEWTGRLGDDIEYFEEISPDGEVGWMDAIPLDVKHDSGNTGETPIDIIYVTLKGDTPIDPGAEHSPQTYPDLTPELILENDRMIVQRVFVEPGQWTGTHGHPGNQVYVQVKGGQWSSRSGDGQPVSEDSFDAGAVGWLEASEIDAGHDMGNTGDTTIEFVLVTIK
jgi:mannose-6-phosphate isomerase-like protein (cupin superfamily)